MSIRVYELARELKVDSSKLISKLEEMDIYVKSHASTITEEQAQQAKETILGPNPQEVIEQRVRPGVIRRRVKRRPKNVEDPPVVEEEVESAAVPESKTAPGSAAQATPPPRVKERTKVSIVAKISSYVKPLLRREQANLIQKVEEEKTDTGVATVEKIHPEDDKKKKKKKKAAKEGIAEEIPPVKKAAKKGVSRRREIITRQEFMDSPERMYRPGRRRKKALPKKTMKKTAITTPRAQKRIIRITETIQVGELARRMGIKAIDMLKKLMDLGLMANASQYLDFEEAVLVAADYGYEVENVAVEEESLMGDEVDRPEDRSHRPPVVTVMGHVDHGKTTLLDTIRKANVVDTEKGGITQHIGAYTVGIESREICFIDTPGHEAFTAMRARGANATDIVVLVVAADDGVMDRTKEAISHATEAEVPIIVAVNKIDKPEADPEKVRRQIAEHGLNPEEWGGDTMFVNVSAKTGEGVDDLLEGILLQAEVLELEANPLLSSRGVILEARMDKGLGPIATTLVQQGILRFKDVIIAGTQWGRVRLMLDHNGKQVKEAGPARAVSIIGFSGVPQAGDAFMVTKDEKVAKQLVEHRLAKQREKEMSKTAVGISFDELYERLQMAEVKNLKLVVKADVQGSVEALLDSLKGIESEKCKLNIVHSAPGPITENDVMLASASGALIVGFNVKSDAGAKKVAERENVDIKLFDVIYELLDGVRKVMEGSLDPEYVEKVIGHAEVRTIFEISRTGKIAGSYITDGKIVRNSPARVLRDGEEVWNGKVGGLKRFKDDVREVAQASECGIRLDDFDDLHEGDIIEVFTLEEIRPSL